MLKIYIPQYPDLISLLKWNHIHQQFMAGPFLFLGVLFRLKHLICLHSHFSLYSALLGFLLLLATVKLKSGFSIEHFGVWIFLSKVIIIIIIVIILV